MDLLWRLLYLTAFLLSLQQTAIATCPAKPPRASLSSDHGQWNADYCLDGLTNGFCHTSEEAYPFLVLEYDERVQIDEVVITNRVDVAWERTQNLHVIVTDTYPVKGVMTTGDQLGSVFSGPGTGGEIITFTPTSTPPVGKYVVIQLDMDPGIINLAEVEVKCSDAPATGSSSTGGSVCFSSLSHVTLATNDKIPVSHLKPGDHINSVNSNGDVISSPFLGWLHHNDNVTTTFLDITTEPGNSISISPLHLIMVTDNVDKEPSMKFANTVGVGDYLLSGGSGLVQVKSVTSQVLTGVYAPLTSTGTVLIDDLLASCYAHIGSHHLAHLAALPFRTFPQILQVQGDMRRYLEYVGDLFLRFADPLTASRSTESEPTGFCNSSYLTTFLIAGIVPVALFGLKKKSG